MIVTCAFLNFSQFLAKKTPWRTWHHGSFSTNSGMVLSNHNVLNHFAVHFSLPQKRAWKIVTLEPAAILKVVLMLRGQRLGGCTALPCSRPVAPLDEATSE